MCFAEAGTPVNKKRIEGSAGIFSDRLRRGVSKLIRIADDECLETIAWIENGGRKLFARRNGRGREVIDHRVIDDEVNLDPIRGEVREN